MNAIVESPLTHGASASVLGADAYRTLAFAKTEDDVLWTREWICIGVIDDLRREGDLLPFTAGDHAVHVQRMPGGRLAGRFNLAQHGGCRVVPLQCRQGAKTSCSFTSCGYSRDSAPLEATETGAPSEGMYQYLGLRPERLLGVRVARDGPLIFVHLDPAANAFAPSLADPPPGIRREHAWLELDVNWKHAGQRIAAGVQRGEANDVQAVFESRDRIGHAGHADETLTVTWRYPNLLDLRTSTSRCFVVLQPTALQSVLCRISTYGAHSLAHWQDLLQRRAAIADADANMHSDAVQWFETALAARIAHFAPQAASSSYSQRL
ncbi:hypothetical protein [Paraburkholderia unamae]|uniref:Phenylpropionate dioxygenase-like ring-hydroxylating dioxygenase large terminal subunit n=1 Tax=Paraburkholderia unamae TaxID=219649 RepID=A0ABX5KN61_9BURK|nr:hypothetical protein [Paraburkholderia unamae]PVX81725.1 hypothetical protein C7402_110129 [Paraburkholderia unamae]